MSLKILLNQIVKILKKNQIRISTAESCTGGLIAYWLTKIPGSSSYFSLGIIPYQEEEKHRLLKIDPRLLKQYQGVSPSIASQMAERVRKIAGADIGISTTGFAGPSGGTKIAPRGTVYIGIASAKKTHVYKFYFGGKREEVRRKTLVKTLLLLRDFLNNF